MSMRDLVTGSDVCTPSDGAGPSNAMGTLVNTLLGGSSKTQEQLRELPNVQPGSGGGLHAAPLTPESAAYAAAMQSGSMQVPGVGPSTMDRAAADAFMRGGGPSHMGAGPHADWDRIFGGQVPPGAGPSTSHMMPPPGMAGHAPLERQLQAFVSSARSNSHFAAGPLTPQMTASLSVVDKCRIRDRTTIMARHMFADMGERFADEQVGNLLASLHINAADLPAELPHVHNGSWHDVWRDASSAGGQAGRPPMMAAEVAAGAQAPWDKLWDQQQRPERPLSTGWASEFLQHPPGSRPMGNGFAPPPPQAHQWAQEFSSSQPAASVAEDWATSFRGEQDAAQQSATGEATAARRRDAGMDGAMRSTAAMVEQLSQDQDPKMRNSKFLQFMSKMSRGELMFDDNKVIERPASVSAWADEFQQQQPQGQVANGWANEFAQGAPANAWANEFSQGASTAVPANAWAAEFDEKQRAAGALPAQADWADEFARGVADIKLSDDAEAMQSAWAEANGWADEFNRASDEENFQEWERIYGHGQVETSYDASNGEYVFATVNPFLGDPEAETKGRELFRRGVLTEAVLALEAAVQADPKNAQAWRLLGTVQAENDDDKQAIAAMVRALGADPTDLDVLLSLGVSHTNELDQAEALGHLTKWLSAHPQYSDIAAKAGQPLDSSQRLSHVVRQFEEASRFNPQDAELQVALGVLAHLSRQYTTAVSSFQRALQLRPQDYSLWNKLGATLANHAKSAEALGAYQKALDLKPNYMRAWTNMGISYANLGDYERSARFYVRALALNPQASHVWGYLRTSLSCAGITDLMASVDAQDLATLQQKLPL